MAMGLGAVDFRSPADQGQAGAQGFNSLETIPEGKIDEVVKSN